MTNEELFKNGDFEELYKQNIKLIYHIAHKYSKQIEFEECVSIANLAFAKSLKHYNLAKKIKFSSYLYSAVKNEFLLYLEKDKRKIDTLSLDFKYECRNGEYKKLEDLLEDNFNLEEEISSSSIISKFYETINKLPENQKIVELGRINGLSYKELQAELDCSKQWVFQLHKRASRKIKYALRKEMKVAY